MESRQPSRFTGKRVHFIGVGGCGMSGLARMLLDAGAVVSGTDRKPGPATLDLASRGATITYEQDGSAIADDLDLVVRTAAVPDTNPEFKAALAKRRPHLKYAQLLGEVMAERLGIAVSGTHGKTTTTSMAAFAMLQCRVDPSFVIGGTVPQLGGSSRSGAGEAFVVEACEFDRSFHALHPKVAIITNIEVDHLDCYTNGLTEIIESFRTFAQRVPMDGRIIANGGDWNVLTALDGLKQPVEWVFVADEPKRQENTWTAIPTGIVDGCHTGDIFRDGRCVASVRLSVPGIHNLFNATVAIAACAFAGVPPQDAAEAVGRFKGADRRMTLHGEVNGAVVVDDYGHHPTEIRTTLRALRERYNPGRLICVFQPHQYSRTRTLLDDFATSFADADLTILPDIYAARDSDDDRASVSAGELMARITRQGRRVLHIAELPDVIRHLREIAAKGDLIVTMGAGNVCDVAAALVQGEPVGA